MKRIIAFVLTFCMLMSFWGCSEKENNDTDKTAIIDLKHFAADGKMPECEYALGQDVDGMLKIFEEKIKKQEEEDTDHHDEDAFYYTENEFKGYNSIQAGMFEYLYKENSKEISGIINYGTAYKFDIGTVNVEIKEALTKFEASEYDSDSEKLFFLPGAQSVSCLKYKFEKNDILFVFVDNALTVTVIYDNNEWSF